MTYIIAYTDINNQDKNKHRVGYGMHFNIENNFSIELTNQIAELSKCLYAIEKCIEYNNYNNIKNDIIIKTDSIYLINKFSKEKDNKLAKDCINIELIEKIYNYCNDENNVIKFFYEKN
jgi:hypothetical protein